MAAMREVEEEAGVKGMLGRCLGLFEVKTITVTNFLSKQKKTTVDSLNYRHRHTLPTGNRFFQGQQVSCIVVILRKCIHVILIGHSRIQ